MPVQHSETMRLGPADFRIVRELFRKKGGIAFDTSRIIFDVMHNGARQEALHPLRLNDFDVVLLQFLVLFLNVARLFLHLLLQGAVKTLEPVHEIGIPQERIGLRG